MLIGDVGIDISQSLKYAGIKMWFFYNFASALLAVYHLIYKTASCDEKPEDEVQSNLLLK